uniref:Uncharacterized protein n=1 Tax=Culex tarsalis TaxID=7177 RepID=A0A1Q3EUJ6_CULTA
MRSRAFSVTRSAHTFIFGTYSWRSSLVTVPTTTAIVDSSLPRSFNSLATRDSAIGGWLVLLINRRRRTILLNFLCVRRYRKRYSLTSNRRYTSSDFGLVRRTLRSHL